MEWITIAAIIIGPIAAVQVQKWLEQFREKRNRKIGLFWTLMATRGARLSPEHVRALNMIDLTFYGGGRHARSKREQSVLDAWKEYLDHLFIPVPTETNQAHRWEERRDELFFDLLYVMAQDVGYSFDKVLLKRGAYTPMAHGNLEAELNELRKSAIAVLGGQAPIAFKAWNPDAAPPPTANAHTQVR